MSDGVSPTEGFAAARQGDRTALLVLGMHRSGTSAVTRLLSLLGLRLPATPVAPGVGRGPDSNRQVGFWESDVLMRLHDEILADAGARWDSPVMVPESWWTPAALDHWGPALRRALSAELGDVGPWVVKDPRMCHLVPLWLAILHQLRIEPAMALVLRNPIEVAESLRTRDQMPRRQALLLWLQHSLAAERTTRSCRRVFVRYEALLEDWPAESARIGDALELRFPRPPDEAADEVARFLEPALRHHVAAPDTLRGAEGLEGAAARVYQLMLAAAAGAHPPTGEFDRLYDLLAGGSGLAPTGGAAARSEQGDRSQELTVRVDVLQVQLEAIARDATTRQRLFEETRARCVAAESTLDRLEHLLASDRSSAQGRIDTLGEESRRLLELHQQNASRLAAVAEELRRSSEDRQGLSRRLDQLERELAAEQQRRSRSEELLTALAPRGVAALTASRRDGSGSPYGWWSLLRALPLWLRSSGLRVGLRCWLAAREVDRSGAFDLGYYLSRNPDVARSGVDPVFHWVAVGVHEGRDPSPSFDTAAYLTRHPEVAVSGLNPLLHALRTASDSGS